MHVAAVASFNLTKHVGDVICLLDNNKPNSVQVQDGLVSSTK